MMRKIVFGVYLFIIHAILVLILSKSDVREKFRDLINNLRSEDNSAEAEIYYRSMERFCERVAGNIPEGSVLFVGDSITQGLCVSAVTSKAVNLGIGGDTTERLYARLQKYRLLSKAGVVVIAIGINDLRRGVSSRIIIANYRNIVSWIPPSIGVVCSAVLPINILAKTNNPGKESDERILALNRQIEDICHDRPGCFWVTGRRLATTTGNLASDFDEGDGIHLNHRGYSVWIGDLREATSKAYRWHQLNDLSKHSPTL